MKKELTNKKKLQELNYILSFIIRYERLYNIVKHVGICEILSRIYRGKRMDYYEHAMINYPHLVNVGVTRKKSYNSYWFFSNSDRKEKIREQIEYIEQNKKIPLL